MLIVDCLCWLYGFKACNQQADTTKEKPAIRQLIKNFARVRYYHRTISFLVKLSENSVAMCIFY